jgi:nicotinate-nucleotide adenylyltransferase
MTRRIGLLGGSFNPAHQGHVHISLEALKRLQLNEIWWLVSPQNPLKPSHELAPYAERVASARAITNHHPRIRITTLEQEHGLFYTIDTLRFLRARHSQQQFVWLMGADNLANFHRWRHWPRIATLAAIVVLDRAPYALKALHGRFAQRFAARRVSVAQVRHLTHCNLPAWAYVTIPRSALSSTSIRKTLGRSR